MLSAANRLSSDPETIDLSVFVACYNEQEAIAGTIQDIAAACEEVGVTYEIIVIDDGSTDESVARINTFKSSNPRIPITVRINDKNRGLAYNYVEGAFMAKGE